jgi:hypothetical protein
MNRYSSLHTAIIERSDAKSPRFPPCPLLLPLLVRLWLVSFFAGGYRVKRVTFRIASLGAVQEFRSILRGGSHLLRRKNLLESNLFGRDDQAFA